MDGGKRRSSIVRLSVSRYLVYSNHQSISKLAVTLVHLIKSHTAVVDGMKAGRGKERGRRRRMKGD